MGLSNDQLSGSRERRRIGVFLVVENINSHSDHWRCDSAPAFAARHSYSVAPAAFADWPTAAVGIPAVAVERHTAEAAR